jgi:5-methyltetrahydrofolate--homocysteine methyltransferase
MANRKTALRKKLKNSLLYLDGGMGTQLQAKGLPVGVLPEEWNVTHPDVVEGIHRAYFAAGSDIVCTNTFGANSLKFGENLEQIVAAAVQNARRATDGKENKFVALDIGPTGKLLKPLGDLDFDVI